MGHSIYVRVKDPASDLKKVRKAIRANRKAEVREIEPGKQFIEVQWNRLKVERTVLEQLSKEIETDVIWLKFQSVVDAFEYEHWHDGKCLRALTFGCGYEERTWERLEGAAEKWAT